jgi:hypothetical protein
METIVAGCLFVMMLVSVDIGYRIGHRRKSSDPQTSIEVIGTVDAAVFGLLGLILAFTFSGASDRLVLRRAQIVQEANAIGTAYLRIDVLAQSDQPAIRELFRSYFEKRIEVFDKFRDRAASNAALEKAEQSQRNIWSRSAASCRADLKPDACLLMLPALNEMIDITTTRTMVDNFDAADIASSSAGCLLSLLTERRRAFDARSRREGPQKLEWRQRGLTNRNDGGSLNKGKL